jgi:hypothetical protein
MPRGSMLGERDVPVTHVAEQPMTRGIRFFPIIAVEIYLTLSVLLFAFGPWPWSVDNPVVLYAFLAFAQVSLALGYWKGARSRRRRTRQARFNIPRLIRVSLFVNCLWIFPKFIVRAGLSDFSVGAVTQQIWFGLTDPGGAHVAMATSTGSSKLALLYALFTPVLYLSLPVTVYYWRSVCRRDRLLLLVVAAGEALTWIATGTSKGVVDAAVVVAASTMPAAVFRWSRSGLRLKVKFTAVAAVCAVVAGGFFLQMQFARRGDNISLYDRHYGMSMNEENALVRGRSLEFKAGVGYFLNYLNQGYYALGLALDEPHAFTWGIGNSPFWTSLISNLTGFDVSNDTYPARLEKFGIDRGINWHTMYAWYASDLTFPGVVLLMFVIGYYFAQSWISALRGVNPYAIAVFTLFFVMILYVPANNQVMSFTPTAFAFPVLFAKWRMSGP